MPTVYPDRISRQKVSVLDGAGNTKKVIFLPERVADLTAYALGGQATALIVEMSFSAPSDIGADIGSGTDTLATWSQLDATLASVGTTAVVFKFLGLTPTAIRARQLSAAKTGDLILTGRRA